MHQLIIAAAGSGKTTLLVNRALDETDGSVLITTYTEANEEEIRRKIIGISKCIPGNITVQTWLTFLLRHCVRPFQGRLFENRIGGVCFVQSQSGTFQNKGGRMIYRPETDSRYYVSDDNRIYSDKIAKFATRCNQLSNNAVFNRVAGIYSHIFIDEVQDLAGYDLEIIKGLFGTVANVALVGDPRQATYLTHHESKYNQYSAGKIKGFVLDHCKGLGCEIDETSLNKSYRNNPQICAYSARLYPGYSVCESAQEKRTGHDGLFIIRKSDVTAYLEEYRPMQLRYDRRTPVEMMLPVMNYGAAKGLSFDRVLIYPTKPILQFVKDGKLTKPEQSKQNGKATQSKGKNQSEKAAFDIPKFYVALTRARYSVGIVWDTSKIPAASEFVIFEPAADRSSVTSL